MSVSEPHVLPPQPADLAKGLGIPKESDFESQDLIAGLLKTRCGGTETKTKKFKKGERGKNLANIPPALEHFLLNTLMSLIIEVCLNTNETVNRAG